MFGALAGLFEKGSFLRGIAPSVIGGLFGMSQSSAYADAQRETNQTNIMLARENRDWQEKMSNTAAQRSAADLEKAGLNRILALGQPASTPAGNVAQVQNPKAQGVNAMAMGIQMAQALADIELTQAKSRAIDPRAKAGDIISDAIDDMKDMMDPETPYNNPVDMFMDFMKKHFKKREISSGPTARTRPMPDTDYTGKPEAMENSAKGRYRENSIGIQPGSIQQHMEEYAREYKRQHNGKNPSEAELRAEWDRVYKSYTGRSK